MVDALAQALCHAGLDGDLGESVILAVAEALNNVAEHAYAGQAPGPVHMTADLFDDVLHVTLDDHGRPMPGLVLPPPRLPDATGPRDTLPEGGFGWFLIHKLTDTLTYNRRAGQNTLLLGFALHRSGKRS